MIIVALVFFLPAFSAAQMQGGSGQHMMGSGRGENMGMMGDMQQMMQSGHMTPAQHHQLLGMMHQLASFSGSQKAVSAMT